ncbi:hypothetical protein [Psychromonas aquimarina]|uniref:hypothetical protein n=1 Tax=Psychromonas aquimarina TaxID=444919 RepID=UPI000428A36E|nr:hypothetical protein [Psychromonas aquimarina]
MKKQFGTSLIVAGCTLFTSIAYADNAQPEEVADMSDPTAVYSSAGIGYSNKGANIKFGLQLPSKAENSAHMITVDVKEGGDIIRGRYFNVNLKTGFAGSIDANYDTNTETAHVSFGALQTIPLSEKLTIYPGLYAGVMIGDDVDEFGKVNGVSISAMTATAQMYSKYNITDKLWINLNPAYTTSLYGVETGVFDLETAVSYQITPRFNARLFHNNNMKVGNYNEELYESITRLEFNYAF